MEAGAHGVPAPWSCWSVSPVVGGAQQSANYAAIDTILQLIDAPESDAAVQAFRADLPFDSIELVHVGCFGPCPQYSIRLRRDGTATYRGKAFLPRIGEVTDTLGLVPYARLCQYIEVHHVIRELEDYDPADVVDWDSFRLLFWRTGNPEAMEFTGGFAEGPPGAWALRAVMDGFMLPILWQPDWAKPGSSEPAGHWR